MTEYRRDSSSPAQKRVDRAAPALAQVMLVCLLLLLAGPQALRAELLVGLPWSTPDELQTLARMSAQVRYVTNGEALVAADQEQLEALEEDENTLDLP